MGAPGGSFFGQQNVQDFGTAIQGGNVGFANAGPNFDGAKAKFADPKFSKARK